MNKTTMLALTALLAVQLPVQANPARDAILAGFAAQAKAADATFTAFSAERGKRLFLDQHAGGKPKTPACTSCHSKDPLANGKTRAGKVIKPIAVSKNPARFTKVKKVAKWFRRNCKSVLGRECSAVEKGDFITYMQSQ